MKRMFFAVVAMLIAAAVSGQRSSLDDFFSKYSNREGYTSVEISGSLLNFLGKSGQCDRSGNPVGKITLVRLVVREKDKFPSGESLTAEIRSIIRRGRYEELVSARDDGADIKFMARMDREMIKELVLVIDGDNQAVVQIEGNLTRDEAEELFSSNGEGLAILEELEIEGK